jgi:hypothetical protein
MYEAAVGEKDIYFPLDDVAAKFKFAPEANESRLKLLLHEKEDPKDEKHVS